MPRFYFNILGTGSRADNDGFELPDQQAAKIHALAYVRALLREGSACGWAMKNWRLIVTDGNHEVVVDLPITPAAVAN
jgi:hypothetical protein